MDLSEVPSQNFWCIPLYSLLFGNTFVRHGMKRASWIDEISWGMTICSMSNLYVFERCVRSYIQNDVKCISLVFCFSFLVFVIFLLIHPQFFEGVSLLPFVSILPILDQSVQCLVQIQKFQWVFISLLLE